MIYGKDVAIFANDALLSKSFEHVVQHTKGVVSERVLDVIIRLEKIVGTTGLTDGQVMNLECKTRTIVTLEELTWIQTHKTTALLQLAVAAGEILGGGNAKEVKACELFAFDIVLAF